MKFLVFTFCCFLLLACSEEAGNVPSEGTTIWLQPDSIEFIHYPDPSNQKQYQRMMIKDSGVVAGLFDNASGELQELEACTHNSKFYLFARGEVYKAIYVSDSCNYLAYAVNGGQRFVKLLPDNRMRLDSLVRLLQQY